MRLPPSPVSLAARFLMLCAFLAGIAGIMALAGPFSAADRVYGVLDLALAALLFVVGQRLSTGGRTWWFAAIGCLAVMTAIALAGLSWFVILLGGALGCLLTPSAREFFAPPAREGEAAVGE